MRAVCKLIALVACLSLSSPSFAARDDVLHFKYTAMAASGASFLCRSMTDLTSAEVFACGVAAGMAVGVGKEVLDSREPGNKFSGKDIRFDLLGSVAGSLAFRVADEFVITPVLGKKYYGLDLSYNI